MAVQLLQNEIESLRSIIRNEFQNKPQSIETASYNEINIRSSILNSTDAQDLLSILTFHLREKVEITEMAIFNYDEKSLLSAFSNEFSLSEKFKRAIEYFQENGIITWAVQLPNPTIISDPFVTETHQSYYILVPLRFRNQISGLLSILSHEPKNEIENKLIHEVSGISDIIAVAVENIVSSRVLKNMNNRLLELNAQADINSHLAGFGELAIKISEEAMLPIRVIETNLELIQTGIDEREKRFEIIRSQLNTLKSINSKLIDYFNTLSTSERKRNKVNIKRVLQDTSSLLNKSFQRHGIEYFINESDKDTCVLWNKIELELTVFGIIMFCIYNMPEGGIITLSYSRINRKTASINISDDAEALTNLDNVTILDKSYRPKHIKHDLISFYSINQYLLKNRSKIEFEPVEGSGNTFRLICPIA